jgi:hypothetical protein
MVRHPLRIFGLAFIVTATALLVRLAPLARASQLNQVSALRFGMRMELTTSGNSEALLNAAQIMKTDWVAQDIKWKDVEPEPGQYQWAELDQLLLDARPYGFHILFSVSGAPDWARPPAADLTFDGPPADYAHFARFMSSLAGRYAGVAGAYEIWPEANLASRWSTPEGLSPERYTDLLRQAAEAVRAADPSAIVVSGGLAPTGANDGINAIDDLVYYQRMYTAGAANYFDALGVRVDGFNNAPGDAPGYSSVPSTTYKGHTSFYFRHYEDVHNVMIANGDTVTPMWITSAGWASTDQPLAGMEYAADINEDQQAEYLVEALAQAQSQPYLGVIIINNFNFATTPDAPAYLGHYSLLRADWSARPAFVTLAQIRQGDVFAQSASPTAPATTHVLPNWRPRLRYTFQAGQP